MFNIQSLLFVLAQVTQNMIHVPSIQDVQQCIADATNIKEIGRGGYKIVYSASMPEGVEAIKLVEIPSNTTEEYEENVARIVREIGILKECTSPHLVRLGTTKAQTIDIKGRAYYLYSEELLPGQSLRHKIKEKHNPKTSEIATLAKCILSAIQEFKNRGVIHRDIKPDNIMDTGLLGRQYVLLDFGIAFHLHETPITKDKSIIPGTLYYIAPEMLDLDFRQNLDYRSDLYTLGLTLYEFAAGDHPFHKKHGTEFDTLYRIKKITPPRLNTLRKDLPAELCATIDQLLKKLPAIRPANLQNLISKMEKYTG